jgi:ribonuclease VapC
VIVVDTSALFVISAGEPERDAFIDLLDTKGPGLCSAVNYVETVMVLTGRSHHLSRAKIDELLELFAVEVVPIDRGLTQAAIEAFERFGKGRHPARLNLADCFSYGLAKSRDLPLLFKGSDFAQTDIAPVCS